jgi:hypothetical protein
MQLRSPLPAKASKSGIPEAAPNAEEPRHSAITNHSFTMTRPSRSQTLLHLRESTEFSLSE